MNRKPTARILLALAFSLSLNACVTLPANAPRSAADPYERWNRGVYKFNDVLDRGVAKPIASAYVRVVPKPARIGVSNFLANLWTPTVMVNDFLQGKPLAGLNDLGRFVLNSTLGLGGLLDPATQAGLARNDEDFGQTLGKWGVHAGPFLELPLLGPSDLRDGPAKIADIFTNPVHYSRNNGLIYGTYGLSLVDRRADLLSYDETLKTVYDPYVFVRDAYLKHRAYAIADGKIVDDDPLVDPDAPDPAPAQPAPSGKAPATR